MTLTKISTENTCSGSLPVLRAPDEGIEMFDDYVPIDDHQTRSLEEFHPIILGLLADFPKHRTKMLERFEIIGITMQERIDSTIECRLNPDLLVIFD